MGDPVGDARVLALSRLIDYAGLFPPASLSMGDAAVGYHEARESDASWVLDRFICPASRLEELSAVLNASGTPSPPWRITVLGVGGPETLPATMELARAFQTQSGSRATIDAVEIALPSESLGPGEVAEWVAAALPAIEANGPGQAFFEVPFGEGWEESTPAALDALASLGDKTGLLVGAKVRCGGLSQEAFPTAMQLAAFVSVCRDLGLPFKATAGLHHPFRHVAPDTGFVHHGFLNLLHASVLAAARGFDGAAITEILEDDDPANFGLDRTGLSWTHHSVEADDVSRTRRQLFVGYGSCDFTEPIDDLTALAILPVEDAA